MNTLSNDELTRIAKECNVFSGAASGQGENLALFARAVERAAIEAYKAQRDEPLAVGGAHDNVHCYECGLNITKERPLKNAIDAWNRRKCIAPPQAAAMPEDALKAISVLRENLRNPASALKSGIYDNDPVRNAIDVLLSLAAVAAPILEIPKPEMCFGKHPFAYVRLNLLIENIAQAGISYTIAKEKAKSEGGQS